MRKLQKEGNVDDEVLKMRGKEENDLVKAGRLANVRVRRALTRKDSLLGYRPNEYAGMDINEGDETTKKRRLRHHSSIHLLNTTSR